VLQAERALFTFPPLRTPEKYIGLSYHAVTFAEIAR
jgi:hypothetical protein